MWQQMEEMHSERYKVLFSFKKFIETIPLSSVECERIFSTMNFIKDKKKNTMNTKNLFYRIILKIHTAFTSLTTKRLFRYGRK